MVYASIRNSGLLMVLLSYVLLAGAQAAFGQTTTFSYQGRLTEAGAPANGTYDFDLRLYDVQAGGAPIVGTIASGITVSQGSFNIPIDFGPGAFPGPDRWLEISVRPSGGGAFTPLTPRQQVYSSPYSIKSRFSFQADSASNSGQLGGLDAARYVQQDAGGNVSIGGNLSVTGSATYPTVNATTQYNLNGQRILSNGGGFNLFVGGNAGANNSGSSNTFVGNNAGQLNTGGSENSFFGQSAGASNTSANFNAFFGNNAGLFNTTGGSNAFFGDRAGRNNTEGVLNAFFGTNAGFSNSGSASHNSFFGARAGFSNTDGIFNSFFGRGTGFFNTTGNNNAFYGVGAGEENTTGSENTFLGNRAGTKNAAANGNTAVGWEAGFNNTASNNSFFGWNAGKFNTTGDRNAFFGLEAGLNNTAGCCNSFFGNRAGRENIDGIGNTAVGGSAGRQNTSGQRNSYFGDQSGIAVSTGSHNTFLGTLTRGAADLTYGTAVGAGSQVISNDTIVLGKVGGNYFGVDRPADTVQIPGTLNVAGNINVTGGGLVKSINGLSGELTVVPGSNITLTPNGNIITIASTASGTITGVTAGTGLIGGGTTGAVTLNLGNTTVAPGSYTSANITVDAQGRVTAASNGSGGGTPVNAILNQTTPQTGANFNIDGSGTIGGTMTANTANVAGNASVGGNASVMGNFGIGTTAPLAKLHVEGGNVLVNSAGTGVILKSPDGNVCRLLTVSDAGAVTLATVTCPQ